MKIRIAKLILLSFAVAAAAATFAGGAEPMQSDAKTTSSQDFLTSVTKGDVASVKQSLKQDPALARARDKDGVSAVLKALYYGKKDVAEVLLAGRTDLDIFEASATGQAQRVAALVRNDKSLVNAFAADGFFPLGLAAFFKHPETAKVLLDAGADVNAQARNPMKVRAIHAAAAAAQFDIARMLIERGADLNARQQAGLTPLHEAAATGQIELARFLVDHGADLNAKADDGKTALTFAVQAGQEETAKFLRERGATK